MKNSVFMNRTETRKHWVLGLILILFSALFSSLCLAEDWVYTTRPGDTLWDLSKQFLQDETQWKRIQDYNKIGNPKFLPPGKKIRIPHEWMKQKLKSAELRAFRGEVTITNRSNEIVKLENGLPLDFGYSITTGDRSSAIVQFADKSTLFIRANTVVKFDTVNYREKSAIVDTKIRLENGRVESRVIPFEKTNSRFEIITPTAVAAVRGTIFRVELAEGKMFSEVVEGNVNTKNSLGEQLVTAGFGNVVKKDQPPEKPEALLSAPDLGTLPDIFLQDKVKLRWPFIEGAEQYRVIITSTKNSVGVVLDQTVSSHNISWERTDSGSFILQVQGIAKSGLQGLPGSHPFNAGLEKSNELSKPSLNAPFNGAQIESNIPTLHWLNVKNAERYRLQFSMTSDFSDVLYDEIIDSQFFLLPTPVDAGKYYWRVAGISAAVEIGPYSDSFELFIK